MIGRITAPAIPYLLGAIVALLIALGVSLRYNAVQWADARAVDKAHTEALKLALAEGRAQVLIRNVEAADAMAAAAEQRRLDFIAEQEASLAAEKRREDQYWRSMRDLTIACGPGEAFVDSFNEAMQP